MKTSVANITDTTPYRVGLWSGVAAFVSTVLFGVVQMLQIFRIIDDPLDKILIYGFSLCIAVPFILEMLALHYVTIQQKQFWSHAAVIFTAIYSVFVTANYVVQLATVIPMSLKGELEEVRILNQTPHSIFWNFDALGYIFMGLATLFAVPVFKQRGFHRWVRGFFLANGLVTPLIAFVYFYPDFSETLLIIGLSWAITAPGSMLLLAIMFAKDRRKIIHQTE